MVVCVWQHSVRMLLRGEICFIINMVASTCSSIFTDHYWLGTVLVKILHSFEKMNFENGVLMLKKPKRARSMC